MNFLQTGLIYENARSISQEGLWLEFADFPELTAFDSARKALSKSVKETSLLGSWVELVDLLKIVHARMARTPCRPVWLLKQEGMDSLQTVLMPRLKTRLEGVDPTVRFAFAETAETLRVLSDTETNPVAICARKLLSTFKAGANNLVVLRAEKLWDEAQQQLSEQCSSTTFKIRKPVELRQHPAVDNIVIFGPPWVLKYRNENFLFGSPLAASIWFVVCGHEHVGHIPQSLLDEQAIHPLNGSDRSQAPLELTLEHEPVNLGSGSSFVLRKGQDSAFSWLEDFEETVRAVPVILGGGKGIYFEEDAVVYSPSVKVSADQRICLALEKRMASDIEPGMLVLLTTEGGGEMIPVVADALLMHRARRIREIEKLWKQKLIDQVELQGLPKVAELLGTNTANIRNWCNPRNIAPEKLEEHLRPLLDLVGLGERYEEIVQAITMLRWAHQSAGMKLQAHLLKSLGGLDLREAFVCGFQDVRDKAGGPVKTVYLVHNVLGVEELSTRLIGRVWDLEESSI